MPKFSVHVALMGSDYRTVSFKPGDEVPEWAASQVGAHCLEPEAETESESEVVPEVTEDPEPDPDAEDEADGEDPTPAPSDVPDFTAPAPRRNPRSRK